VQERDRADPGTDVPVIGAKICRDLLPAHAIARPRLVALLGQREWRVASITAGPGLGKSVFLLQWLATLDADQCAVVTLDEADNAPERFWRYIAASLQRARPDGFARSARAARASCNSDVLVALLLEDAANLDRDLVLAIEDLHTIRNQAILEAIALLVDHLPPQVRVVFTSRKDVALPTARWRARSWLVDVRGIDLAFTQEETALLFDALGESRLDADVVERLTNVTEGWPAALQLAALAMRDHDPRDVVADLCGRSRMIADFLVAEVVDRQEVDMREFMTAISVADSFDAELCDALTGRNDSAQRLKELAATTHFLVLADDAQSTYRYHHLLRDVLRAELARQHPDSISRLHRMLADILERRGEASAAAVHLIAAGDHDRAFDLSFADTYEVWDRGNTESLRARIDAFPVEYISASPHRMLVYALTLSLCTRFDESREWIERAQKALEHDVAAPTDDIVLLDALRMLSFNVDGCGDEGCDGGARAWAEVERGSEIGMLGAHLPEHLTRALLMADNVEAAQATLETEHDGSANTQVVLALGLSARIAQRQGLLNAADEQAQRAFTAASAFGIPNHVVTIDAHLAMLGVLLDRNDIAGAADRIETISEILDRFPSFAYRVLVRLEEVRLALARDGVDVALELLSELRLVVDSGDRPTLSGRITALEARVRIEADELRRATVLVSRLAAGVPARDLLEARLVLASNQPGDSTNTLEQLAFANPRHRIEALLLLTRAALAANTDFEPHVREVVALAAPDRLVRSVLDEGSVVTRLVRQCAEASDSVEAERFAIELGAPPRQTRGSSELIVPLSDRERDVLRFLPGRLTTREIAAECFMSVNTVKAHLKRIYSKLGVSTRAEAVQRATMLGELRIPAARTG
jgi:LuxR family maltose regulon positive regulatory protein